MLLQIFAGVMVLGSAGAVLWFARQSWTAGSRTRWTQVVTNEAATLRTFAARVGGRYEAGHGTDSWGREVPVAGSVTGLGESGRASLDYVTALPHGDSVSFLPRVSLDLPAGTRWAVEPTAGAFVPDPRVGWRVNGVGRIPGNTIRMLAGAGHSPETFRKAFGVPEDATPEPARILLWSVGERSQEIHFSPGRLEVVLWPRDLASTSPSAIPQREGGYNVDELVDLVGQVCALGAALSVQDTPP